MSFYLSTIPTPNHTLGSYWSEQQKEMLHKSLCSVLSAQPRGAQSYEPEIMTLRS